MPIWVGWWRRRQRRQRRIENILLAISLAPGSAAFIEKKSTGLAIVTAPIPEPQAYALFLAGLALGGL